MRCGLAPHQRRWRAAAVPSSRMHARRQRSSALGRPPGRVRRRAAAQRRVPDAGPVRGPERPDRRIGYVRWRGGGRDCRRRPQRACLGALPALDDDSTPRWRPTRLARQPAGRARRPVEHPAPDDPDVQQAHDRAPAPLRTAAPHAPLRRRRHCHLRFLSAGGPGRAGRVLSRGQRHRRASCALRRWHRRRGRRHRPRHWFRSGDHLPSRGGASERTRPLPRHRAPRCREAVLRRAVRGAPRAPAHR
ncbi:MAG: hypothetical protein QOF76_3225 [Solirubrobacteraceae bacterium]|nr:hypothetical protein [Solirubrobacteraceae bacterium]